MYARMKVHARMEGWKVGRVERADLAKTGLDGRMGKWGGWDLLT